MLTLVQTPNGQARWFWQAHGQPPLDLYVNGLDVVDQDAIALNASESQIGNASDLIESANARSWNGLADAAKWLLNEAPDILADGGVPRGKPTPEATDWPLLLPGVPGKALALGRNFAAHAEEMGAAPSKEMLWFCKLPDILVGHEQNFEVPSWLPGRVDPEAELVLLIGAELRNASLEQAAAAIAGYSLGNDLTARGVQASDKERSWPWVRSKNVATFGSIGPGWIPTATLKDFESYTLQGLVNGEVRQQASLAHMLWPPANALVELSRWLPLYPGDVVFLGTPAGVGAVQPGDQLEVRLDGLLSLRNSVVSLP